MKRKQKLLVSICAPVATLGIAAGVAGILLTKKSDSKPQFEGDYSITFDAGNGRVVDKNLINQKIYAEQALDRIPQPKVASNRSGEYFAGWKDETGRFVTGKQTFTKDTKLTAAYSGVVGNYCMVTFLPGPAGDAAILQGNTSVAVKTGYMFFMVNRPTATAPQKYFKQWLYAEDVYSKDGKTVIHKAEEPVLESHTIEADCKLKPDWTRAVTMTWDPGDGATISRGQSTTTMESGTAFNDFNQPQLIHSLGYYFNGWYKKDGSKWQNGEAVTANSVAIAHWRESTPEQAGYATIQFSKSTIEGQPEVFYSPTNFQVVECKGTESPKTTTWKSVVRPTVTTRDGNWEIDTWTDGTYAGQEKWMIKAHDAAQTEYTDLHDDTELEENTIYDVYPIMKSAIKSVTIVGDEQLLPEDANIQYLAPIEGGKSQDVDWAIVKKDAPINEDGTIPETSKFASGKEPATIKKAYDGSGSVTVKSVDEEDWTSDLLTFDVIAISTVNPKVYDRKNVQIIMPYASTKNGYNRLIWFHESDGTNKHWVSLLPGQLCTKDSSAQTYTGTYLTDNGSGAKTRYVYKNQKHTNKLYVGRAIKVIPDQFCYGWTGLNAPIDLENSNVTEIQGSFLENCTNFNKKLDISHLTSIGNHFLYNCSAFNNGSTDEETNTIEFNSALTSIGDDFLGLCSSFNSPIELPTVNSLSIGSSFLYGCTKFNQDLMIPSNVTSVGSFFMTMCGSFTSTLTIATDADNFSGSIHDISVDSETHQVYDEAAGGYVTEVWPIVETGFKTDGSGASGFDTKYPDFNDYNSFRKHAAEAATEVTSEEWKTQANLLRQDNKTALNMQMTLSVGGGKTLNDDVRIYRESETSALKVSRLDKNDGLKNVWNEITDSTGTPLGWYARNDAKADVGKTGDLTIASYTEDSYYEDGILPAVVKAIDDSTKTGEGRGAFHAGVEYAAGETKSGYAAYTFNSTTGMYETDVAMQLYEEWPLVVPKIKFTKSNGQNVVSAVYLYSAAGADNEGEICAYGSLMATIMVYHGNAGKVQNVTGEMTAAAYSTTAEGASEWEGKDRKQTAQYKEFNYRFSLKNATSGSTKKIEASDATKSYISIFSSKDTEAEGSGWGKGSDSLYVYASLWRKIDGKYVEYSIDGLSLEGKYPQYGLNGSAEYPGFDGLEIDDNSYITICICIDVVSGQEITDIYPKLHLEFKTA